METPEIPFLKKGTKNKLPLPQQEVKKPLKRLVNEALMTQTLTDFELVSIKC